MRSILLVAAFSLSMAFVADAQACINDQETKKTEQEFRSNYRYENDYDSGEYEPGGFVFNPTGVVGVVGGLAMLGGSIFVTTKLIKPA